MKIKEMSYMDSSLGYLGDLVPKELYHGFFELRVGDVVSFEEFGEVCTRPVVYDKSKDSYGIFGYGSNRLTFSKLTKVLSYEHLTERMLNELQGNDKFTIREVEIKELTMTQLTDILGYEVKIVK